MRVKYELDWKITLFSWQKLYVFSCDFKSGYQYIETAGAARQKTRSTCCDTAGWETH